MPPWFEPPEEPTPRSIFDELVLLYGDPFEVFR